MTVRFPVGFAAGLVLVALAAVLASCQEPEEDTSQVVTEGPRASETASASTTATPAPVPSGWATYADPALGFSLAYSADLVPTLVSGPSPHGEFGARDVDFRSTQNSSRGFVISVFEANPSAFTLDQFADEFYCLRDKREGSLGGTRALFCTKDTLGNQVEATVVASFDGRFLGITAAPSMSEAELSAVVQSFRFVAGQ